MTSRIYAATTVDDDSDDGYDDTSPDLRAFTADLDEIAKTLEQDTRQLFERAARRRHSQPLSKENSSPHTPPPPATASYRSRTSAPLTDPNRSFKSQRQYTPTYTSTSVSEDVPTPMQTPAPLMFSPLFESYPRHKKAMGEIRSQQRPVKPADLPYPAPSTAPDPLGGGDDTVETWKYMLDIMRDTVERQEDRIQSLERQNDELRSHVRSLEQEISFLRRQPAPSPPPAPPAPSPSPVRFSSEPPPFRSSYSSPPLSTFTSPRTNLSSSWSSSYRPCSLSTPGTKFVDELAQLIDVDPVHHAPLSRIMDDHFARTSQLRRQYGWGDY